MKKILFIPLISALTLLAQVDTAKIIKGDLASTQAFTGTLTYNEKSRLASESDGKITHIDFDEGDFVKKGHVLLKIDSQILDANIASTQASIKEVRFSLEKAKMDFKRYEALLKKASISQQKYDEFYFQKMQEEQKLSALESSLEALKIAKDKKSLRAPFSGYITKRNVNLGEWLKQGSEVATLINPEKIDILVALSPTYINHIKTGKVIPVQINQKTYQAKIIATLLEGDEKTRTFPLKLRLLKTKDRFFDGMSVQLQLQNTQVTDRLLVPRDAVIKRFGKDVVFIKKENKAMMIPVVILGYQGTQVAVSADALSEGDEVIIKGNERIRPNQELKP